jgi:hypothetical protein
MDAQFFEIVELFVNVKWLVLFLITGLALA